MTVIYVADGAVVQKPTNPFQEFDRLVWLGDRARWGAGRQRDESGAVSAADLLASAVAAHCHPRRCHTTFLKVVAWSSSWCSSA